LTRAKALAIPTLDTGESLSDSYSPTSTEGPAFGAAILAGVAAGAFRSVEEGADALVHVTQRSLPEPATVDRYREIHRVYRALYGDLRERSHDLAALA
jgi:xylulokinase